MAQCFGLRSKGDRGSEAPLLRQVHRPPLIVGELNCFSLDPSLCRLVFHSFGVPVVLHNAVVLHK